MSFIVFSLPRSRSAWTSQLLKYQGRSVGHDIAIECDTMQQFLDNFKALSGSCETGAVIAWKLLKRAIPDLKIATIRRPLDDVVKSLAKFNLEPDLEELLLRNAMLDTVEQVPGTLRVEYDDMRHAVTCKQLFEHCLGIPFDWNWWAHWDRINCQVIMPERIQTLINRQDKIMALEAEVMQASGIIKGGPECLGLN